MAMCRRNTLLQVPELFAHVPARQRLTNKIHFDLDSDWAGFLLKAWINIRFFDLEGTFPNTAMGNAKTMDAHERYPQWCMSL